MMNICERGQNMVGSGSEEFELAAKAFYEDDYELLRRMPTRELGRGAVILEVARPETSPHRFGLHHIDTSNINPVYAAIIVAGQSMDERRAGRVEPNAVEYIWNTDPLGVNMGNLLHVILNHRTWER